ncbi:MAG: branched-chain amino acid ABC transporter permease [Candidatus Heimdallarchaeota archaeon]|nr:branched-chain amino acid ABC transporter permease [Candidatus Heimdallarchaeota archaeon]
MSNNNNTKLRKDKIFRILFIALPILLVIFDTLLSNVEIKLILILSYVYTVYYEFTNSSETSLNKININPKALSVGFIIFNVLISLLFIDTVGLLTMGQYFFLLAFSVTLISKLKMEHAGFNNNNDLDLIHLVNTLVLISLQLLLVNISSNVNYTQHMLLLFLFGMQVIFIFGAKIKKFPTYSFRDKSLLIGGAFFIFLLDLIVVTNSDNNPANLLLNLVGMIVNASTLILISMGLTLTTRVRKFGNFAHSESITVGLFFSIPLYGLFPNLNLFLLISLIFIITGIVGMLGEKLVFGPLQLRNSTPLTLMVGSIGFGLVIRQLSQEIWGGLFQNPIAPRYPGFFDQLGENLKNSVFVEISLILGLFVGAYIGFRKFNNRADTVVSGIIGLIVGFVISNLFVLGMIDNSVLPLGSVDFFGLKFQIFNTIEIIVLRDQVWAFSFMIIAVMIFRAILTKTTLGISMRATADDMELAQITGINTKRVIYWTWFLAAGITGAGAIFRFSSASFFPGAGFRLLLIIFAVVILGGFDSFEGTLISAFIIAFVQSLTVVVNTELVGWEKIDPDIDKLVFWTASRDWTFVIPFVMIIIVLLFRPRGIFGLVDPRSKL